MGYQWDFNDAYINNNRDMFGIMGCVWHINDGYISIMIGMIVVASRMMGVCGIFIYRDGY